MAFLRESGFFGRIGFAARTREPARFAADVPRVFVVNAVVKNFSGARGEVAVFFEPPRQADEFRMHVADPSAVAEDTGVRGGVAGEHRGTRRTTQRILRVGAVETHARSGKLIEIRRHGEAAVTAEFRAHIVRDDEQNIVARRRISGGRGTCGGDGRSGGEQAKKVFH